jgi:hypothetical protein
MEFDDLPDLGRLASFFTARNTIAGNYIGTDGSGAKSLSQNRVDEGGRFGEFRGWDARRFRFGGSHG